MTEAQVARLLTTLSAPWNGNEISAQDVTIDVASGAPTNDDGTMNLLHYTAWLAREHRAT